jgi:hypothetical protein
VRTVLKIRDFPARIHRFITQTSELALQGGVMRATTAYWAERASSISNTGP